MSRLYESYFCSFSFFLQKIREIMECIESTTSILSCMYKNIVKTLRRWILLLLFCKNFVKSSYMQVPECKWTYVPSEVFLILANIPWNNFNCIECSEKQMRGYSNTSLLARSCHETFFKKVLNEVFWNILTVFLLFDLRNFVKTQNIRLSFSILQKFVKP